MTKVDIKQKLIQIISSYLEQVYPNSSCPNLSLSKEPLLDILDIDSLMSIELSLDILDNFSINDEKIQCILVENGTLKFPKKLNIDEVVDKIDMYLN